QRHWLSWLPLAKFAFNNSTSASTGLTPFFATLGLVLPLWLQWYCEQTSLYPTYKTSKAT
ncbi:hypothetical protein CROQUDRAFT_42561, partial [Cronartium quercuum f. sp. fusiforme G11]